MALGTNFDPTRTCNQSTEEDDNIRDISNALSAIEASDTPEMSYCEIEQKLKDLFLTNPEQAESLAQRVLNVVSPIDDGDEVDQDASDLIEYVSNVCSHLVEPNISAAGFTYS